VGEVEPPLDLRVRGRINFVLIAAIIGAILASAAWKPGVRFDIYGTAVELQNLVRDGVLLLIALISLAVTRDEHRVANGFTFEPIFEVTILFFGIFICIAPVLAMLHAGPNGAFAGLVAIVAANDGFLPREAMYFWLTGGLSAFLDNVPTYLVFFELAGGDPAQLMGVLHPTLAAISMGAVYMGALTYIGNAPNFMVYAIARDRGIRMPSFFGFMGWSVLVLLPVFALTSWLFVGR
jgi:Na+/H+ antiporter NhaD/arsenite permease-like protein